MADEINYNRYIERITEILEQSPRLFPNTVGQIVDSEDLVEQIISYDLAVPTDVLSGIGPPHIFVGVASSPIVSERQAGRDARNVKGARLLELEFHAICVVNEPEFAQSQQLLYDITSAVTAILGTNQTLRNAEGGDPIAISTKYVVTPYTDLNSDEKNVMARTVVIRPRIIIDLRNS